MAIDLETIDDAVAAEAVRTTVPEGFPTLPEVPGGRYSSVEFHELENEFLWKRSWLIVGREEALREPGSFLTFDRLDSPIVVIRGKDGELRAFYNVCRHRGARIVREPCGVAARLRCQYHNWTYALDGRLLGVPDIEDLGDFDKSERGLISVRCETWGGFVFINLDDDVPSLAEHLAPVSGELECFDMANLRLVSRSSYKLNCNWKVAQDAFLEGYHVPNIHPSAIPMVHYKAWIGLLKNGHSRLAQRKKLGGGATYNDWENIPDIPSVTSAYRHNGFSYNIFPNFVSPIESTGLPAMIFWPDGHDKCEMEVYYLSPDWGEGPHPDFWDRYIPFFDGLLKEDQANLTSIQASLNSRGFTGMVLNYQERRIYHWHEELDRVIGANRVPESLRVEPLLEKYVEPSDN